MLAFKAKIEIIGINPFVFLPDKLLAALFEQVGRSKGPIPIKGEVNGKPYTQTLIKFSGAWRLYINTTMLDNSPKRIGETIQITVGIDNADRTISPHPDLIKALEKNKKAKEVFDSLTPSLRNEVIRYINNLKTEASVQNNIQKAIAFLLGKGRFVGREL
ncbi:MAG: YdeI/OmpD-associated family protein [Bacteroidota bacterium]